MKNYSLFTLYKNALFLLLIGIVSVSCSNSASTKDEEHEHEDAEGVILKINGETVVEKQPNQSLKNNFPSLVAGEKSSLIEVVFLDHDGHEFLPDDPELFLNFELSESNVINIKQTEDEPWSFRVEALAEGTTELIVLLMHHDHPDFESPAIEIHVDPKKLPTKSLLSN